MSLPSYSEPVASTWPAREKLALAALPVKLTGEETNFEVHLFCVIVLCFIFFFVFVQVTSSISPFAPAGPWEPLVPAGHVIEIATTTFKEPLDTDSPTADLQQQLGDRVTALVREHPTALRYVARSAADGEQTALELFDAFLEIARTQWQTVASQDLLRPDIDTTWAALHAVIINLGTVLLTHAIDRHLPEPFLTPTQLARWNTASNALFREGIYRETPTTLIHHSSARPAQHSTRPPDRRKRADPRPSTR